MKLLNFVIFLLFTTIAQADAIDIPNIDLKSRNVSVSEFIDVIPEDAKTRAGFPYWIINKDFSEVGKIESSCGSGGCMYYLDVCKKDNCEKDYGSVIYDQLYATSRIEWKKSEKEASRIKKDKEDSSITWKNAMDENRKKKEENSITKEIVSKCATDWGSDYTMIEFCIKRQTQSLLFINEVLSK